MNDVNNLYNKMITDMNQQLASIISDQAKIMQSTISEIVSNQLKPIFDIQRNLAQQQYKTMESAISQWSALSRYVDAINEFQKMNVSKFADILSEFSLRLPKMPTISPYNIQTAIKETNYSDAKSKICVKDIVDLNEHISSATDFSQNKFPEDVSIKQMESILNDSDDEVESLTEDQIKYLKKLYWKDFAFIDSAKTIDDLALLFDRLNVITDFIPGYQYKLDLYKAVISHLINGINLFGDTLALIFVVLIIQEICKHFTLYNNIIDYLNDLKDHNPFL